MRMYDELAAAYPLLTPREEARDEAAVYEGLLDEALGVGPKTLLELGSGAGHVASWMHDVILTLSDVSADMLAVARRTNPGSRCVLGDMRSLRLDETFDVVFAHDALCYLRTEEDLRAALTTARDHVRPGGVVLMVPDFFAETFEPGMRTGGIDGRDEGIRFLAWMWQRPDETEGYVTDYAILHRRGTEAPRVVHDRHEEGLFPRATWERLLTELGLVLERSVSGGTRHGEILLARRPGGGSADVSG